MAPVMQTPELCTEKPSENGLQVSGKREKKKVKTAERNCRKNLKEQNKKGTEEQSVVSDEAEL